MAVNEARYIQHNPQTHEGSDGLAILFKRLSKTSPRVNIVRAFEDGDYVFAHTEYDFANRNIGFELFRFEDGRAVEHWDNIQPRYGPNLSGHSMVDGPIESTDHELTEANRALVRLYVEVVLIKAKHNQLEDFISKDGYTEHNPHSSDGLTVLRSSLEETHNGYSVIDYQRVHRIMVEGSFVLCVSEGELKGIHSAFYDLFRIAGGKLVEHWNTVEKIAPRSEWKNGNGKF